MTRTAAREIAARVCFAANENGAPIEEVLKDLFDEEYYSTLADEDEIFAEYPDERQAEYITSLVNGVFKHRAELLSYVEKYSTGWKTDRISKTALAIIYVAMFEILYMPDIPEGASIDEAVNLAKKYEEPETVPFINGLLGAFVRNEAIKE